MHEGQEVRDWFAIHMVCSSSFLVIRVCCCFTVILCVANFDLE